MNDFLQKPGYYAYSGGSSYVLKKPSVSKALKRLRESGYVDFVGEDELVLRLTDKGREKALVAKLHSAVGKWDGKWRMVIFDIPEKKRAARDLLRYHLKAWGFTPWQQSVWVSKENCTKPLREYISSIGIEDWVLVVESNNIGR